MRQASEIFVMLNIVIEEMRVEDGEEKSTTRDLEPLYDALRWVYDEKLENELVTSYLPSETDYSDSLARVVTKLRVLS